MNILFIKHFFVGFMVSDIQRVSVFGHCPYSVTFPYTRTHIMSCTLIPTHIHTHTRPHPHTHTYTQNHTHTCI